MMVIPYQRAKIAEKLINPTPIGIVKVKEIEDGSIKEQDLDMEQSVLFKFMKINYLKCFELAKDERFKQYLKYLEQSFILDEVHQFLNFLLTVISLPQFVNSYKFLADVETVKI
jgi:hypothetical protein